MAEENDILTANDELWEKVFASMDKNVTQTTLNTVSYTHLPLCCKQLERGLSVTAVIHFVAGTAQFFSHAFPQSRFILYQ